MKNGTRSPEKVGERTAERPDCLDCKLAKNEGRGPYML